MRTKLTSCHRAAAPATDREAELRTLMTICRHISERHGGHIGVEDDPGGGARFWFTLPVSGDRPGKGAAAGAEGRTRAFRATSPR